jgi:hypothetical protein
LIQRTTNRKQTILITLMDKRSPAPFFRERFSGFASGTAFLGILFDWL